MNSCTKEAIETSINHCSYISDNCPDQNFIQFNRIYYCYIDESVPFLIFFTVTS